MRRIRVSIDKDIVNVVIVTVLITVFVFVVIIITFLITKSLTTTSVVSNAITTMALAVSIYYYVLHISEMKKQNETLKEQLDVMRARPILKWHEGHVGNIISFWAIDSLQHDVNLQITSGVGDVDVKAPARNVVAQDRVYACPTNSQSDKGQNSTLEGLEMNSYRILRLKGLQLIKIKFIPLEVGMYSIMRYHYYCDLESNGQ
ncbi:hypothetical protein Vsou_21190 [Vulcanisaeta souniana JCM 11219]|uniref:Uncharacterized protein n=1 Tax=Vulcanisaeta souniana JCM 11219 TaxID=1293586 RepID=A0A830E9T4_9CREN|nr:hypothetical protein Vsou_21190 [Vulcanisaeta souniana JCM 11219]GGI83496.1 hypothetical protein GCM10007112_20350 [Vulcanisaeta souniana JCM 11219]